MKQLVVTLPLNEESYARWPLDELECRVGMVHVLARTAVASGVIYNVADEQIGTWQVIVS